MISPFSKANSPGSVGSKVCKARTRVTMFPFADIEAGVGAGSGAGAAVTVGVGTSEIEEGAEVAGWWWFDVG